MNLLNKWGFSPFIQHSWDSLWVAVSGCWWTTEQRSKRRMTPAAELITAWSALCWLHVAVILSEMLQQTLKLPVVPVWVSVCFSLFACHESWEWLTGLWFALCFFNEDTMSFYFFTCLVVQVSFLWLNQLWRAGAADNSWWGWVTLWPQNPSDITSSTLHRYYCTCLFSLALQHEPCSSPTSNSHYRFFYVALIVSDWAVIGCFSY